MIKVKTETYYCDKCEIEIKEGMGVTVNVMAALNAENIKNLIESVGPEGAIIEKHLCNKCYDKFFEKEPVVYENGEPKK